MTQRRTTLLLLLACLFLALTAAGCGRSNSAPSPSPDLTAPVAVDSHLSRASAPDIQIKDMPAPATTTANDGLPIFAHCNHQAGGDMVLEACTPSLLAQSYQAGTTTQAGPLTVEVSSPSAQTPYHSGSSPGLVQVLGSPMLDNGATITFHGTPAGPTDVTLSLMKRENGLISDWVLIVPPDQFSMSSHSMTWKIQWSDVHATPVIAETSPQQRDVSFNAPTHAVGVDPYRTPAQARAAAAQASSEAAKVGHDPVAVAEFYAHAITSRNGDAICAVLSPAAHDYLKAAFTQDGAAFDCGNIVGMMIGYPHENEDRVWKSGTLTAVGKTETAKGADGKTYTAVPARFDYDVVFSGYSSRPSGGEEKISFTDVIWLTQGSSGNWQIAKPSLGWSGSSAPDMLADAARDPRGIDSSLAPPPLAKQQP